MSVSVTWLPYVVFQIRVGRIQRVILAGAGLEHEGPSQLSAGAHASLGPAVPHNGGVAVKNTEYQYCGVFFALLFFP